MTLTVSPLLSARLAHTPSTMAQADPLLIEFNQLLEAGKPLEEVTAFLRARAQQLEISTLLNTNLSYQYGQEFFNTTFLHQAVLFVREDIVTWLLQNGATQRPDQYGHTPLHIAAFLGHFFLAELCIRFGANPRETNMEGCNALHFAGSAIRRAPNRSPEHPDILKIIQLFLGGRSYQDILGNTRTVHPAAINANTHTGWSVLHCVASTPNLNVFLYLLQKADLTLIHKQAEMILHLLRKRAEKLTEPDFMSEIIRTMQTALQMRLQGIPCSRSDWTPVFTAQTSMRNRALLQTLSDVVLDDQYPTTRKRNDIPSKP